MIDKEEKEYLVGKYVLIERISTNLVKAKIVDVINGEKILEEVIKRSENG